MHCVHCCVYDLVGDLMLGQKSASQKHQSLCEFSRNTGIQRSSIGCIVNGVGTNFGVGVGRVRPEGPKAAG